MKIAAQTVGIVVAIAFVYRVVCAGTQRQTNTQTQTRVLQGLAFIQQPLPSSVTSLKLCDFLLLFLSPNSIFRGDYSVSRAVGESLFRKTKSVTMESLSVCLINQLNFSSGCATDAVIGKFFHRVMVKLTCYKCYCMICAPVLIMMLLLPLRHVNKLMTLILKIVTYPFAPPDGTFSSKRSSQTFATVVSRQWTGI